MNRPVAIFCRSLVVLWLAVALTLMSGFEYLWGARAVFRQPPRQPSA